MSCTWVSLSNCKLCNSHLRASSHKTGGNSTPDPECGSYHDLARSQVQNPQCWLKSAVPPVLSPPKGPRSDPRRSFKSPRSFGYDSDIAPSEADSPVRPVAPPLRNLEAGFCQARTNCEPSPAGCSESCSKTPLRMFVLVPNYFAAP